MSPFQWWCAVFCVCELLCTINGDNHARNEMQKDQSYNSSANHFLAKHGIEYSEWKKGVVFERDFWGEWMKSRGGQWPKDFENRNRKQRLLDDKFVQALAPLPIGETKRTHALILDCGSGPMSLVGNWHPDFEVELIALDPLNSLYNELLSENKIIPYPRIGHAFVERVSELWPANFFDVVHIQNALDHSGNPLAGILSMLTVLKPLGKLLILHGIDEAINENWVGFHQWNFNLGGNENESSKGKFIITHKDGTVIVVDDHIKGVAKCKHTVDQAGHTIETECTKIGNLA